MKNVWIEKGNKDFLGWGCESTEGEYLFVLDKDLNRDESIVKERIKKEFAVYSDSNDSFNYTIDKSKIFPIFKISFNEVYNRKAIGYWCEIHPILKKIGNLENGKHIMLFNFDNTNALEKMLKELTGKQHWAYSIGIFGKETI